MGLSGWGQMDGARCGAMGTDGWGQRGTDSAPQDGGTAGMDGEHGGQTDTHRESIHRDWTGSPEGFGGS